MNQFQSTLPLRGATYSFLWSRLHRRDFNPRSPYGERRSRPKIPIQPPRFQSTLPLRGATRAGQQLLNSFVISIHAPLTGSDFHQLTQKSPPTKFQSTLPLRGATMVSSFPHGQRGFQSTLPLRGATRWINKWKRSPHFNPRSPYGERLYVITVWIAPNRFQSTLPLRGATLSFNGRIVI